MEQKRTITLSDAVRNSQEDDSAVELVYDVETGQFSQIQKGTFTEGEGMLVTQMTRDGFA